MATSSFPQFGTVQLYYRRNKVEREESRDFFLTGTVQYRIPSIFLPYLQR